MVALGWLCTRSASRHITNILSGNRFVNCLTIRVTYSNLAVKYDHIIGSKFNRWTEGSYSRGQIQASQNVSDSFILLSGAYRSGKSEIGSRLAIRHAFGFPGSQVGIFRKHLASLKKSTLLKLLELVHPDWVADWSNSELVLTLKNRSTVTFLGCEFADRIGSIELTYAFIDEAHELDTESLGMIQGRLSGQLQLPRNIDTLPQDLQWYLSNSVNIRQAILACNPKSVGHHLYRDFFEKPKPGYKAYTSNTVSNANLPDIFLHNNLGAYVLPGYTREWVEDQVALIRQGLMPEDGLHLQHALTPFGRRNLLGLWVAMEGAIWPSYSEETHFVSTVPEDWGNPQSYYAAVDWGFHNPRIGIFGHYKDDRLAMVASWAEPDTEPHLMIQKMAELQQRYSVKRWFLPPDQPGLIKTAKATLGNNRVRKARNPVLPGIDAVSRRWSEGTLLIVNDGSEAAQLANKEISGYEWLADKATSSYKDEPLKVADHFCDLTRYLVFSLDYKKAPDKLGADDYYEDD